MSIWRELISRRFRFIILLLLDREIDRGCRFFSFLNRFCYYFNTRSMYAIMTLERVSEEDKYRRASVIGRGICQQGVSSHKALDLKGSLTIGEL